MIQELGHCPTAALSRCLCQREGNKHNGLCKDDRHYVCSEELEGDVLARTAHSPVAFNTLGILNGHLASCLDEHDCQSHNGEQCDDFEEELDKAAAFSTAQCSNEFLADSNREAGNNTYHDDKRYAVSDTLVGDTLTEPKDKHTAGCENNRGRKHKAKPIANQESARTSGLCFKVNQIGRSLEHENGNCQPTRVLVNLPTTALAFALHFLEIRNSNSKKLNDNRGRDVRHNSQCEDRGIGECATGEHVQQGHESLTRLLLQLRQTIRCNTRQHDE